MNFDQADRLNETIRAIGLRHRALTVAALAPLGIHPGHKLLLFELESAGPRTQAQLATACGYEPPSITLSVRQLERDGLVVRRPSTEDRRATVVALTAKGRDLLPAVRTAWREAAERTVAGLDPVPLDGLMEVLESLAQSLREAAAGGPPGPRWRPER